MAIPFNAFPIPQEPEQPSPWAVAGDRTQKMMQLLSEYQMQKKQQDMQKEQNRQQRILDFVKLKAEYGQEATDALTGAGVPLPSGIAPAIQPQPTAAPVLAAAPQIAGLGPNPSPVAPPSVGPTGNVPMPGPTAFTDITPELLASIRAKKGAKGADKVMKEQQFFLNSAKDSADLKLKSESLEKANRPKKFVTRDQLAAKNFQLEPGEELLPPDPSEVRDRGAAMQMATQFGHESKDFRTVAGAMSTITSAPPNAAGDMQLIYGLMKIYDPNSVVRETEFANAENARGVPDSIRNSWNKAKQGTFLTAAQRQEFKNAARGVYESRLQQQRQIETEYKRQAAGFGLDPAQVVRDYSIQDLPPSTGAPEIKPTGTSANALPPDKQSRLAELRAKRDAGTLR